MKNSNTKPHILHNLVAALPSLLVVGLLALPANVRAIEDPPNCSLANGGAGNTSQGGINFQETQAHVGDIVHIVPSLGMVNSACRAVNATGSVWIATGRLTNFLVNVTLDPGPLVTCPQDPKCQPGQLAPVAGYTLLITQPLVGAGVSTPNGSIGGLAKTVRAAENGEGNVLTGDTPELLADFHTTTLSIVTPCINVVKQCAYPPSSPTCFQANNSGTNTVISFTGFVTNCGDIVLTNVTLTDPRALTLTVLSNGLPALPAGGPYTLSVGARLTYSGTYNATAQEVCAGQATNTITVRGTDRTVIQGPNATVTATATAVCLICKTPCLAVTKNCDTVQIGQANTVSGVVTNCGNLGITNIIISDNLYGTLATIPSLAPGASASYSRLVTNNTCGNFPNTVTANGTTVCGAPISATATNTCVVTEAPCIQVTKNCDTVVIGSANTVSGAVTNCGNVTLTNIVITDNLYGPLATIASLAPGASQNYSRLVTNSCGNFPNTVTASARSVCGTPVSATATNVCVVTENPCIEVTKSCDRVNFGTPNTITALVTNCGNVRLTGITVTDNLYGSIGTVATLAPGGSATVSKLVTITNCGSFPNVITAAGASICGTPVQATSAGTCVVDCPRPQICVTEEVVCEMPTGCLDNWSDVAVGAKLPDNSQCPYFCYRIRVTNCGTNEALTNVTVTDTNLNLANCNFPTTLAIGQTVECIIAGVMHCEPTTNHVTACGIGEISQLPVCDNDQVRVDVRPIGISCNVTVNGRPFTTIPCDGTAHPIDNEVEICNTGELPLANITIDAPDMVALGGECANIANLRLSLLPGQCTNIAICTAMVTCPPSCGLALSNHITVRAEVDTNRTDVCAFTHQGSNNVVTVISTTTECEAQVGCTQPNACRTTGGGRQDDPLVYPANVRYVTHGGQVGAPVGNKVCTVTEEFYLGNPCIHGRWTHVRHQQGGLRGNFHARYYDTLDCACLDTNTTSARVAIPGVDGAADQTYVNLVYGPGTVTEGVCNADDHKVAGPQPRPAPANKMVFTGVGDWADPNGRRAPRATLFRVDLEDRSEPGGSHPKGGVYPPDRYRIRIWVLSDAEIKQLKGGQGDRYLLNFRNAISACNGLNVQDGATVPNGTAAFGVRAPDIDDGGELERGNRQIHPAIKNCDPSNPQAPPVPPDKS